MHASDEAVESLASCGEGSGDGLAVGSEEGLKLGSCIKKPSVSRCVCVCTAWVGHWDSPVRASRAATSAGKLAGGASAWYEGNDESTWGRCRNYWLGWRK